MPDQRPDINAALLAKCIQIVAYRFPGHVDPGPQDRQRDLFGVGEEFEVPLAVARPHRSDNLTALTDDDGSMAVVNPRAAIGVPDRLRVEMGVVIDEPRGDDAPFRIYRPFAGCAVMFSDPDYFPPLHRH